MRKYPQNLEGLDFVKICIQREICENCKSKNNCPGQEEDMSLPIEEQDGCKHWNRREITPEEKYMNKLITGVKRPKNFK